MAIYRGVGGSGDANNDAIISDVAEYSLAAQTAATNAANSATSASSSATSASGSASAASTSATNAASSASSASTSATNAANSATSAASSATSANSSKNAAALSETNAANSASAAATSEANAATSEANAASSETNAASSASAASTSATNAASSASSASTSATNASNSAYSAAASASSASLSAANAATSETNAALSETNAATSEANALASETAAAASESATAAIYDNFDDRYLGVKTTDPTLDNDGDALVTGALYFNSTTGVMMVYNGTGWQSLASGTASVTSFNGRTGTVTLTSTDVTDALTYTPLAPSAIGTTVQAYDADTTKNDVSNTFTTNQVISTSSSSDALRITQTGAGNALVVEDSANPDSTPFVIDTDGRVISGSATPQGYAGISPYLQVNNTGASTSSIGVSRWVASAVAGQLQLAKSRGAAVGTRGIVSSEDDLGSLTWAGDDGTNFVLGASIAAQVDGTPGTNSMPGRLVFRTSDSGTTGNPKERMRIDSSGNVGVNTTEPEYKLDITAADNVATTTALAVQNASRNYGVGVGAYQLTNRNIGGTITTSDYTFDVGGAAIFNTNGSERMRITSVGSLILGGAAVPQVSFYNRRNITGSFTSHANHSNGTVQSDVTTTAYGYSSDIGTVAESFTLGTLSHFSASQAVFGAGSTVNNQHGFRAEADLTGATNNYGFYANNISVSTGKSAYGFYSGVNTGTGTNYNFYAAGTAANYFAGETTVNSGLTIGRTAVTSPAASDGNVFSGTYTPTLTNVTNIDLSTARTTQYMRVGNVVTVSGRVTIDATTSGTYLIFRMSLPVASNIAAAENGAGTFRSGSNAHINAGIIYATSATDDMTFSVVAETTAANEYYFHFTYRVI